VRTQTDSGSNISLLLQMRILKIKIHELTWTQNFGIHTSLSHTKEKTFTKFATCPTNSLHDIRCTIAMAAQQEGKRKREGKCPPQIFHCQRIVGKSSYCQKNFHPKIQNLGL